MKKMFAFCVIFFCFNYIFGLDIHVGTVLEQKSTMNDFAKYDTTAMYLSYAALLKNPSYYNGQRIMFLPTKFKKGREYDYISGFSVSDSIAMPQFPDTIWVKKRKKVRDGDFYINIPKTNVYNPERIVNKVCKSFGHEMPGDNYGGFNLKHATGFATNYQNIEGQVFSIVSCSISNGKEGAHDIIFLLKDKNNTSVEFKLSHHFSTYELQGQDSYIFPVLLMAYYEKYKQEYVGNSFVLKPSNNDPNDVYAAKKTDGRKYKVVEGELNCSESGFFVNKWDIIPTSLNYCEYLCPFLIFQDKDKTDLLVDIEVKNGIKPNLGRKDIDGDFKDKFEFKFLLLTNLTRADAYYAEIKDRNAKLLAIKEAREQAQKQEEIKKINAIRKEYGKAMGDLIIAGKVRLGMTDSMCRESWGAPDDINTSIGPWGVHEQWVYGYSSYLYFENGILTSIQN